MANSTENDLAKKIRDSIEKEDSQDVNMHYCHYRAYIAGFWLSKDDALFDSLYKEYNKYFLKQWEKGGDKKQVGLW